MVVEEYLSGAATQAQLSRQYNISPHLIIRWRKDYAAGKLAYWGYPLDWSGHNM
jgi:transposase-like protein